jgi:hypothetical protein
MIERIILIEWEGPFTLSGLNQLNGDSDCGLYQIYVHHPVYGAGVLAYIGVTWDQTFSTRIVQNDWGGASENDPNNVEVYVGRLKYEISPTREQWSRDVANAERLLIHAHGPGYNSTNIGRPNESDPEIRNSRILNTGAVRALHREVSSLMWTSEYDRFRGFVRYRNVDSDSSPISN